jgi:hypothetical protein
MKKVIRITESDLVRIVKRLINEQPSDDNDIPKDIRRRLPIITQVFTETFYSPDNDPNDFSDEFEYADNIISYAITKLIRITNDKYFEINESNIRDYLKETYGEFLLEKYVSEVDEDDEDDDF